MLYGTASTLIKPEDIEPGALDAEPYLLNVRKRERRKLTVETLINGIDWEHIEGVGKATLMRIWLKYIPAQ